MLEVCTDGETQEYTITIDALNTEIQFAKMSPSNAAPSWNEDDCILLRLNDEFVLVAQDNSDPYVYKYSGPLNQFDGTDVCYRVFHYTALYMNLKLAGSKQ